MHEFFWGLIRPISGRFLFFVNKLKVMESDSANSNQSNESPARLSSASPTSSPRNEPQNPARLSPTKPGFMDAVFSIKRKGVDMPEEGDDTWDKQSTPRSKDQPGKSDLALATDSHGPSTAESPHAAPGTKPNLSFTPSHQPSSVLNPNPIPPAIVTKTLQSSKRCLDPRVKIYVELYSACPAQTLSVFAFMINSKF